MAKSLNQKEWIQKARKVWGNLYDYSRVSYFGSKKPVELVCSKHGNFEINAGSHISSKQPRGCQKCSKEKQSKKARKTFDHFLEEARACHGLKFKYERETYVNARSRMLIICPLHGSFSQRPESHLRGQTCPKCAIEKNFLDVYKESIEKIKEKITLNSDKQVTIIEKTFRKLNAKAIFKCAKHGQFELLVSSAYYRKDSPCQNCRREEGKYLQYSTEDVKRYLKKRFGNKYKYKPFIYVGGKTKIIFLCSIHGEFIIQFSSVNKSPGCPRCSYLRSHEKRKKSLVKKNIESKESRFIDWLNKVKKIHGTKFSYSNVEFKNYRSKIIIICQKHGEFKQTPEVHLKHGCRICADEKLLGRYTQKYFQDNPLEKNKKAILYYLHFNFGKEKFFKVGVTTTTLRSRFGMLPMNKVEVSILGIKKLSLYEAFILEQKIQKNFGKKYRYIPDLNGKSREYRIGKSECFSNGLSKYYLANFNQPKKSRLF